MTRTSRDWSTVDLCAAAVVASAAVWNPWGLVGRHEIRLLICWTALALGLRAAIRARDIKVFRGWQVAAGFLVLVAVSAVAAGDWWTTVLGHADRHLGVVGWASLLIALFVGANVTSDGRTLVRRTVEATGTFVAVVAIGQWLAPEVFDVVGPSGDRPTSTFGSATFTAAFLAIALPFLLDDGLRSQQARHRTVALAAAASVTVALLATGSRGAWIGGAVGAAIVLWSATSASIGRRVALVTVSGAAIVVSMLTISNEVLERAGSLAAPTEGTAGGRLTLWRSAWDAILERPVVGWGPERTRVGLTQHLPADFEAVYGDATVTDRAHNAALDVAITIGLPGALVFTAGLVLVLVALARWHRSDPIGFRGDVAFAAATAAHLPHLFFNFVQLDVDLPWAIIVGCMLGLSAPVTAVPVAARAVISTTATAGVVAAVVIAGGLVLADTSAGRGVEHERAGQLASASADYRRAVGLSFGDARYEEIVARFERRRDDRIEAIAAADRAAKRHRHDPYLGELPALIRAEAGTPALAAEALELYQPLVRQWPDVSSIHAGIATASAVLGDTRSAERSFVRAIEIAPENSRHYRNLALLYAQTGSIDDALVVLDRATAQIGPDPDLERLRDEIRRMG